MEVDYRYGSGPDEVDEFFRTKRSWSNVKDEILGHYIDCYLKTVQRLQRRILIVDGFSGPGIFGDDTPGSPLIICKSISDNAQGRVGIACLFADAHPGHRVALERNLAPHIRAGVSAAPFSDWSTAVARALELGAGATLFFYLDPYGIKELDFEMVRQIYERDAKKSTEVLINFSFRTFMRMSGNWSYTDSASEISRRVKEGKTDTVNRVMGGDYWQGIITDPSLDKIGREDAVIDAYMERVRQFFPYVYSVPVKERDDTDYHVPADELARYHLIFGTRSPRAVVYMNDVALNALQPYLRQFKDGLLFDMTPERYKAVEREEAKAAIVNAVNARPLKRPDIYEAVIPRFFMHYRKKDYRAMIDELTFKEGRLHPDTGSMKTANKLNDDTLLSAKPWPVRR
jgi:three-Cys-motif partner protein